MVLNIKKLPDSILREKCKDTSSLPYPTFLSDMIETMVFEEGIGLAAPQVGYNLNIIVVDTRPVSNPRSWATVNGKSIDINQFQPLILINPIVKEYGLPTTLIEGCLSIPHKQGKVTRKSCVEVSALDRYFNPISFDAGGMLGRCIQHEYDHLKGVLFTDYL